MLRTTLPEKTTTLILAISTPGAYSCTLILQSVTLPQLGTFLSAHPLAEVREPLRDRIDCPLADVAGKPDGAWLMVGGIVTAAKKVRTRSGGYVMFATLDDLDGSVELFVRDAAGEAAESIEVDRVILARGRVDHKEPGQTSLVVAEAEPFEPSAEVIAAAAARARQRSPETVVIRLDAGRLDAGLLNDLKAVF